MMTLAVISLAAKPASAADRLDAKERKARVECAAGNFTEGVRLLAELWVETEDATHLYNQGRCYGQSGQNDLAISRFREYLRKARLPNGKVLIVGGASGGAFPALTSAELYW
jgi:Flp pilus assembly protein TadD